MKKIILVALVLLLFVHLNFAQNSSKKHFEIDVMAGMNHYASSFFHARNSVLWYTDPAGNLTDFSGYGRSVLPAFNLNYFFNNGIGITAGGSPITADNSLYVDDGTASNYDYCIDQVNINVGIAGRLDVPNSPLSLNFSSGLIVAPFDISKSYESNSGGSYLEGDDLGVGFYGDASFQIKIISFLRIKTMIRYSFIPAEITLYGSDGKMEQNIHNLNIGGIAIKSGLSFQF
ncbi:MAG TPA: hypothetical protein VKP78_09180 [bacterium]|nr:hypothetical protein [bacterium]